MTPCPADDSLRAYLCGAVSDAEHAGGLVEALRARLDEPFTLSEPMPSGGTP